MAMHHIQTQGHTYANTAKTYLVNINAVNQWIARYKKGCTRLATASNKGYQLLAHGRGSLRVLRLLPSLKLVAMILLKYC